MITCNLKRDLSDRKQQANCPTENWKLDEFSVCIRIPHPWKNAERVRHGSTTDITYTFGSWNSCARKIERKIIAMDVRAATTTPDVEKGNKKDCNGVNPTHQWAENGVGPTFG
jgi:hypothetical protein